MTIHIRSHHSHSEKIAGSGALVDRRCTFHIQLLVPFTIKFRKLTHHAVTHVALVGYKQELSRSHSETSGIHATLVGYYAQFKMTFK
jgi:hypothetical protein